MTLYVMALAWILGYKMVTTTCYQHKQNVAFARSNHVTNRWLKGDQNSNMFPKLYLGKIQNIFDLPLFYSLIARHSLNILCTKSKELENFRKTASL